MNPAQKPPRIDALDLIRGVAICGLAPINIQDFASPDEWLFQPGDFAGWDLPLWLLVTIFGMGKFVSLFSLLFGASMILQTRSLENRSLPVAKSYLPRLGWLWFFGMLHAYLIWWGDILVGYAVTGFIVFWCRNWSAKAQAITGAAITLVASFVLVAIIAAIFLTGNGDILESELATDEAGTFWDPAVFAGSWLEQMPQRAAVTAMLHVFAIPLIILPFCGSLMLVGMALCKSGFFEYRWRAKTYRLGLIISLLVGLPLSLAGLFFAYQSGWKTEALVQQSAWAFLGTPFIAAAYAISLVIWNQTNLANWLQSAFKSVGRMAFSNYIGQSLIFSLIFYGSGFGLYGKLSFTEVMLVCPCVWLFQMIFSSLWLRRFKSGPLEWLWRKLASS